jgi:hypothetical protein
MLKSERGQTLLKRQTGSGKTSWLKIADKAAMKIYSTRE